MNPIREHMPGYTGPERRRSHRAILVAFWAVVGICIVISSASIVVAHRATNTANRSEKGFCIAIKLIENGAVADSLIALNPRTAPDIKKLREGTARGGLSYSSQLRSVVHCEGPPLTIRQLYKRFHVNPKTSEDKK